MIDPRDVARLTFKATVAGLLLWFFAACQDATRAGDVASAGQGMSSTGMGGAVATSGKGGGGGQGGSAGALCPGGEAWVEIPVRFHLVRSSLSELNATLTAAEVPGLVAEVQSYWDQACIRIQIESVIQNDVSPEQEQAYTQAWQGDVQGPQMKQLMTDVMPKGNRLSPGWNVMIFRQFNKFASGVYLSEIGSVLWAEALPPPAGSGPNPPVILAHEVGHALGLLHYEGAGLEENLMCEDVMQNQTTAAGLTPEQIGIARAQALTGKTFVP